jgi:malate dehydrogenase (oxaloacetate-decarboxylating)
MVGTDLNPGAMEIFAKAGGTPMSLDEVMRTADIVIGVTGAAGLLKPTMIRKGQIILAMSNPRPEISPEDARNAGAAFAADGRSVNNGLAFPGIFRGALNARAHSICNRMKIAAARTIASFAATGELVPSMLNLDMHKAVAQAVERAAFEAGVARARSADLPE